MHAQCGVRRCCQPCRGSCSSKFQWAIKFSPARSHQAQAPERLIHRPRTTHAAPPIGASDMAKVVAKQMRTQALLLRAVACRRFRSQVFLPSVLPCLESIQSRLWRDLQLGSVLRGSANVTNFTTAEHHCRYAKHSCMCGVILLRANCSDSSLHKSPPSRTCVLFQTRQRCEKDTSGAERLDITFG